MSTLSRDVRTLGPAPPKNELISVLRGAGQRPLTIVGDFGETILVLPHGGRVLGLYSARSDDNFLWTCGMLSSVELALEHFASDRWCNSGGDRTWLAAEIDLFYPHYPDTAKQYFQPRQLDPGKYSATAVSSEIVLENTLSVYSFRHGWSGQLRITKCIRTTQNPLAHGQVSRFADQVEFAGYKLISKLEVLAGSDLHCRVGLWNLLQLPGGGEMFIPTYRRAEPVIYFGDIPAGDLRADERCVRYRMAAPNEQKVAVDAIAVAGRAGYFLPQADHPDRATLVVRSFHVDAAGAYIDVPLHSPHAQGHVFQACNIDADYLGRFAELEYHVPAITKRDGQCTDVSQVWAFRGPREAIVKAAYELLGVAV